MKKEIPLHIIPDLSGGDEAAWQNQTASVYLKQPLSLYIHFPFCIVKCPFCPIMTVRYNATMAEEYLKELKKEIESCLSEIGQCRIDCIHFGGGTPSLLKPNELHDILKLIGDYTNIDDTEILLEVHPEFINEGLIHYFSELKDCTVNVGAQSFDNTVLLGMKRHCSNMDILHVNEKIKKNVNAIGIDYICDWTGSNIISMQNDLKFIEEIQPNHISQYPLYFQSNTQMILFGGQNRDIERKIELNSLCSQRLAEMGYKRYSVFHYDNGRKTTHQYGRDQLRGGKWIGFGAGAYTYLGHVLYVNSDIQEYVKGRHISKAKALNYTDCLLWDFIYLIRTIPLNKNTVLKKYGAIVSEYLNKTIFMLLKYNYIESSQNIALTWKGVINIDHVEQIITEIFQ